jgi:hypothetical protein
MNQKPSVGRIVHYQSFGSVGGKYPSLPRAAVITEVCPWAAQQSEGYPENVGLAVLNPEGFFFNRNVPYSETPEPGCWSWPPRV